MPPAGQQLATGARCDAGGQGEGHDHHQEGAGDLPGQQHDRHDPHCGGERQAGQQVGERPDEPVHAHVGVEGHLVLAASLLHPVAREIVIAPGSLPYERIGDLATSTGGDGPPLQRHPGVDDEGVARRGREAGRQG